MFISAPQLRHSSLSAGVRHGGVNIRHILIFILESSSRLIGEETYLISKLRHEYRHFGPCGFGGALLRPHRPDSLFLPRQGLKKCAQQILSGKGHIMSIATKRTIFRWIHIVFAIPIIGYIYSPFDQIPNYAPATRFVFVPVLVLSGLWMWKGHVVRRLFSRRPTRETVDNS